MMTLLVRDEEDIVESTIRFHHQHGVDHFVVTDNGSVDATVSIIESLSKEIPIHLFHEPPSDYSMHRWVTRMARFAKVELNADWVINADADEFFVCRESDLQAALFSVPKSVGRLRIARHDYVTIDAPADCRHPSEWMIYRKKESRNPFGEILPPKMIHRGDAQVTIYQGNHEATGQNLGEVVDFPLIELLHFPIRNYHQFEIKVRNGGSGYAVNKELPPTIGKVKRRWYDLLLQGKLREEFERVHYHSPGKLAEKLATGELIEDLFLAKALSSLSPALSHIH